MEIINNANTLLNEIRNNSYLTINDNGEIVKQSTFKGILRKIGDFFKNGNVIAERQQKLSSAMNKMLAQSKLSTESFEGISNNVYKAFENNKLTATVSKLKAMSQLNNVDPQLRVFAKSVIDDLDKNQEEIGNKAYTTIMNNLMHSMTNVFKDVVPNDPETAAMHNAITSLINNAANDAVEQNKDEDFSYQFEIDVNRNNYCINGKKSYVEHKDVQGIKNELKSLFPNKTTRVFVSELLCQTIGNISVQPLKSSRAPNGFNNLLNVKIPDSFIGKLTPNFNYLEDYEQQDPNRAMYDLKANPVEDEDCGYNLEVTKDDSGKIIGATIIKDSGYYLVDNDNAEGSRFGHFFYTVTLNLDLSDPDKTRVTSSELSYGGERKGTTFVPEDKLEEK